MTIDREKVFTEDLHTLARISTALRLFFSRAENFLPLSFVLPQPDISVHGKRGRDREFSFLFPSSTMTLGETHDPSTFSPKC